MASESWQNGLTSLPNSQLVDEDQQVILVGWHLEQHMATKKLQMKISQFNVGTEIMQFTLYCLCDCINYTTAQPYSTYTV